MGELDGWRDHAITAETPPELNGGAVQRYWHGGRWTDGWRAHPEAAWTARAGKNPDRSLIDAPDGNADSAQSDSVNMVIGVVLVLGVLGLAGLLISTVSFGPNIERGDPDGMIESCRASRGLGGEVDFRESDAWQPSESNTASVTLRNSGGDMLATCDVEVTRDSYRVR